MTQGIYTFANDVVFDQLVALLNSIEANVGMEMPVCVIPYNDQTDRIQAEIAHRPQVSLFTDTESIQRWEQFAARIWSAHHDAQQVWRSKGYEGIYRLERHRKLCCLDGPFEQFIYFDADTLALNQIDSVFQLLDRYDWVTNDFQHKSDFNYIFDCSKPTLLEIFPQDYLASHLFCSGWFASKKGVFTSDQLADLLTKLEAGEANVLAWRDSDQTVLNYLVLRGGLAYYNLAMHPGATGSHCSSAFEERDHLLYDHGKRVMYLHYMSLGASNFARLCAGQDIAFPYRDLFLHYRYLRTPEQRPSLLSQPNRLEQVQRSVNQFVQQKAKNFEHRLRTLRQR